MQRLVMLIGVCVAILGVGQLSFQGCVSTVAKAEGADGVTGQDSGTQSENTQSDNGQTSPDVPAIQAGQCNEETPCTEQNTGCFVPGYVDNGCGIPPQNMCEQDDECKNKGAHFICQVGTGPCGANICAAGCKADADCSGHQLCDTSDFRCKAKACQADKDCPTHFACATNKTCARKPCTKSSDCPAHCVRQRCYATPGKCQDNRAKP